GIARPLAPEWTGRAVPGTGHSRSCLRAQLQHLARHADRARVAAAARAPVGDEATRALGGSGTRGDRLAARAGCAALGYRARRAARRPCRGVAREPRAALDRASEVPFQVSTAQDARRTPTFTALARSVVYPDVALGLGAEIGPFSVVG